MGEKRAPVQGWPAGIPWSLHLEAYAAYCKKWRPQPALIDLEGSHCRGGFHTSELDEFIPGWRERASEIASLRAELTAAQAVADDCAIATIESNGIPTDDDGYRFPDPEPWVRRDIEYAIGRGLAVADGDVVRLVERST